MEQDRLAAVYSDANPFFRVCGHMGWGALVNLGYYTLPTLPAVLGGLSFFQRRLETRSLELLEARPGHRVLDACCGRGHTVARLGASGCDAVGVDITAQQIARARARYGHAPRTTFAVGDVTALPRQAEGIGATDGSFDRVHCLEAAFHLSPAGRRAFLAEAYRVLRPGGRFAWSTSHGTQQIRQKSGDSIREVWCVRRGRSRSSSPQPGTSRTRKRPGSSSGAQPTGPARSSHASRNWE
ncbi:methyltransferase domain-containing protein [Streptomyces kanamyceticus]|uniref:class I SAM-dependent methyltransferase n=1 Tax=Streptomyces kanamyceticus TaxID=1967 RepID=UPI0037DD1940